VAGKNYLWILDYESWLMAYGLWIMDYGLWIMDYGLWIMEYGLWIMDYKNIHQESLFDLGPWIMKIDDLGSLVIDLAS
jgi:hypothetical protein